MEVDMEARAKHIRSNCVEMSYNGQEGHLGSALSCVDILVALYSHFNLDPDDESRDRLYFSKGHACSALYATLAEFDFLDQSDLYNYAQHGEALTPHPDKNLLSILEMSAGSLGHGLGIACGAAYALKQQGSKSRCIVLMGDGECNEGSVWEAAQFAAAHKLDNLLVVVDYNRIQSIGRTDDIAGRMDLGDKFEAFGWDSDWADGHDIDDLLDAWECKHKKGMPTVVVAYTTAGKGVSFMEDQILWHYRVPDKDEVERALEEING